MEQEQLKEQIKARVEKLEEKAQILEEMNLAQLVKLFIEETKLIALYRKSLDSDQPLLKSLIKRIGIGAIVWAVLQIILLVLIVRAGNL